MAVKSKGLGKGLGKGLDSLIVDNPNKTVTAAPKKKAVVEKEAGPVKLKIGMVEPNREQPRKYFEEDALIELADSIKQKGIISPILVKKRADYYEIIAGERRWRAAKMAGLKEVPVIINNDYTDQEILEISIIENIQRERLNAIEEGLSYKRLIEEFNLKQDEVAERVSKSRTEITNKMRLLKLDERVQNMLISDMISMGHARALLGIEDAEQQYTVAQRVFDEKLSVRDIEKIVKAAKKAPKVPKKKEIDEQYEIVCKQAAERLSNAMGSKVNINQKTKGKGKIEIEFYSQEELDRLLDLMLNLNEF